MASPAVVPAQPGQPERVRHGMCRVFMAYNSLESWRAVRVTRQRTARDYADTIRWLYDEVYPHADKIVIDQGNLNTHTPASLYEAFAPAEALRLKERTEWHYTDWQFTTKDERVKLKRLYHPYMQE